jgi:hypothetical protein
VSDFATLKALLLVESHKPGEGTQMGLCIVRALRHYQPFRTYFTQKTGTFTLAQGVQGYTGPADLLAVDDLRLRRGTSTYTYDLISRVDIAQMRDLTSTSNNRGYPRFWVHHGSEILLYPIPADATDVVEVKYQSDATRDETTGVEITASATTETNEWFRRGEEALRTRALYDFFLTKVHDSEKAELFKIMNREAESSLNRQTVTRDSAGLRTRWSF